MVNGVLFWTFVLTNLFVFVVGSALTYLSYAAYQRVGQRSFRYAILGFGTVTVGSLTELVYELLIERGNELDMTELLVLRTGESALIGLGLVFLFYSLVSPDRS